MKKFTLRLLSMLMLLTVCGVVWASELTVNDGTGNNDYVPVYGLYADEFLHTQIIYPAASLASMTGEEIHSMKFYLKSSASASWGAARFEIRLSEVSASSFSSTAWNTENEGTLVYSGELDGTGEEMNVVFTTDYTYNGGNLLFDLVSTAKGSWKSASFYGVSTTGASVSGNSSTSAASATANARNFLPKTTFNYGAPPACPKPIGLNVVANGQSATISWESEASSFSIAYAASAIANPDDNVAGASNTSSFQKDNLTLDADHYFWVKADCGTDGESEWAGPASVHIGYCVPVPSSRDGKGITGVAFGTGTDIVNNADANGLPKSSPYYGDYSSMIGAVQASLTAAVDITFATGYSYGTIIWVDWDNSLTFDDDEIVYAGESSSSNPTILNATFTVPATQPIGDYRMRIAAADSYYDSHKTMATAAGADPCPTGSYTVVHDYTLRVLEAPSCMPPTALVANSITSSSAVLNWAVGSETAWKLYYKKASDVDFTEVSVSTKPYTLSNLSPGTVYQFKVIAVCGASEESEESAITSFTTECATINTFPWSENFEAYAAGDFAAPCWVNEHISGAGTQIFKVSTSAQGGNSSHLLQLPDMTAGTLTKLALPEMTLPNANYQFVLDVYRSTNSKPTEGIRVFVSVNGEIEGATELAFISRDYTVASGEHVPAETAVGWYTYELPLNISGKCYIILRGESQYGLSTYMDNFFVEQIPTCKKPSALMLETPSSRTAHTATLKWTAGDEDQDAWQIVVDTIAAFNPDTVPAAKLIPADNDTFVVDGLLANKQYYAYVRANCGNGDFSAWSSAKASFKTLEGNKKPTGLAYDASTLSSAGVTVSWNGVESNDLHVSYDIYWAPATVTAVPDEPAAPNLISGIIASSYAISGLDEETEYKVWIRDNCGADGLSDWTNSISFTTLASCAVPFSVAASEVTAYGAKIAWEGNSDNYNVEYRTAAYAEGAEEAFGTSIPTGWSMYTGLLNNDGTATLSSATYGWSFGTNNGVFDNHARVNIYGNYQRWLVMPKMAIEDGFIISFDMALTAFSGTVVSPATTGTDDKFIVLISTDNMATWTILRQWDNAGSKDVYNDIACSANGENININLSAYSGQSAYIAFYGESTVSNADNNLHIDNVLLGIRHAAGEWNREVSNEEQKTLSGLVPETKYEVRVLGVCGSITTNPSDTISFTTLPSCVAPTALAANNITATSADLSWTAGGSETAWTLYYKKSSAENYNEGIVVTSKPYTLDNLDASSSYMFYVVADCSSTDHSEASAVFSFDTECGAVALPFSCEFNATSDLQCWTMEDCETSTGISSGSFAFYWTYNPPQYLISPELVAGENLVKVKFDYKAESTTFPESFEVGYSTTDNSISSFTWGDEVLNVTNTTYQSYSIVCPAGTKYVSIKCTSEDQYYLYIDNFSVSELAPYSVTINASRYATFFCDEAAYVMPAGVAGHAYTVDAGGNGHLSDAFYSNPEVVPAGTPLVLEGDANTYSLVPTMDAGIQKFAENELEGVSEVTVITDETGFTNFVLSLAAGNIPGETGCNYETVGFYWVGTSGVELQPNRAYLKVDNSKLSSNSGAPSAFFLIDDENNATWLNNLQGVEGSLKFWHEGHMYILRDSIIYDATGRKVRELK